MFKPSKRAIVTAGLAGVLMIGVCGCSSSTETKTEISTETTDENGSTTQTTETTTTTTGENGSTTQTTETTTTTTDENGSKSTVTESAATVDMGSWQATAWEGTDEKGNTVYYAKDNAGSSQALIAIADSSGSLISHDIGAASLTEQQDGVNTITINDAAGNEDFTFGIVSQEEDGTTVVNLGDQYGQATLKVVDWDKFIEDVKAADPNGEFLS